jgi:hypothetical protein
MKKIVLLIALYFSFVANVAGQGVIGMNRAQLEKGTKSQESCEKIEYKKQSDGTAQIIMTIKENAPIKINTGLQTIIFYLNAADICAGYGHLYDINFINDGIKSLNSNFVSVGENKWIDYKEDLEITLFKNVAFYLITYQPKTK